MSLFLSPTFGKVTLHKLVLEIANFVEGDKDAFYRLVIGTDSHVKRANGHSECNFVTAIVVHKVGTGARYFWQKDKINRLPTLREKIYTETLKSLETAHKLVPELTQFMRTDNYDLEIHVDVGQKGKTRELIREVVGMVSGNGFTVKTKPESWAASTVADKHT